MTKQFKRIAATLVALAALAGGGVAIAQAQSNPAPAPTAAPEPTGGPDTDSVQSGDQTAPDTGAAEGPEAPGTETAANDDGPGGHADEPGNRNADHQFEGAE
jgi:hypothetical protein